MKKQKTIKPFYFKTSNLKVIDKLNAENPINLKYNEDLINRIYSRYPIIDKSSIALITQAVFMSFRELLILGKILNFNKFLFDTKLHFSKRVEGDVISTALRVRISTPPSIK
jgi:hypothetical protein